VAVILVVAVAAAVGALLGGFVAWRVPNFDPAAPRADTHTIAEEVVTHPRTATFLSSRLNPSAATGLALTVALAIAVLGAIAIGSLFVMVQHNAGLARYDLSAARWGGDHATGGSTHILKDISLLGGTPVMIAVALVAAITQFARSRIVAVFWFMALVVLGQVAMTNLTKVIVDRPRPDIHQLTGFSGASFPSGHAATAAATFAAVALLVGRGRSQRAKALLAGATAGIAFAVATTRVLLGVHWMTDVIAGLAMGWGWFAICSIAFGGRLLAFGQPVKVAERVEASSRRAS
jgi:membrane-associated phospholipid phosphatase